MNPLRVKTAVISRDHVRKAMRQALRPTVVRPRRPRPPVYGDEVIVALRHGVGGDGRAAGERMAPFLPEIVDRLRACGELDVSGDGRPGGRRLDLPGHLDVRQQGPSVISR